jgi:tetratricopeptide (TPR) repeat protein
VAVGLDSNDALLRAYLGKAYFEEKRDDLSNQQFHIAQGLDPLDPTAFLYEAIKQQTENRPGEALKNVQKSIELNDNRAVYRSRLLLDSDRAARGTSLARIYNNLGFEELGVREATASLTYDPTAAAAHRFLSDSYQDVRRREIARVSELLQAQMLQDININPIQPSLSVANLNLVTQGGPAVAGFNEFTPLFESRQTQLNVSGLVGNEDTYGAEGTVSMLYDRYSVSAGGLNYRSDGWRDNNDNKQTVANLYFQSAITPELNAQVEFRELHTDQGDLAFRFDPAAFSPNFERKIDQDIYRAGVRYSPTPNSDILTSFIYSDANEKQSDNFPIPGGPTLVTSSTAREQSYQGEVQYLFRQDWFNLTVGNTASHSDLSGPASATIGGVPVIVIPDESENIDHEHPYGYLNVRWPQPVLWTFGLSYDDYDEEIVKVNQVNPKVGVQWFVTDDLILRAAAFKVVKPALSDNRTLEPTEIAGFNQLFDDSNGTKSTRYGVGVDWHATETLALGGEATWRYIDFAAIDVSEDEANFFNHQEQTHRVYAYWTPIPEVALSAEFVYDKFKAEESPITIEGQIPEKVQTFSVPLGVRYFHPSGFFAGVTETYVNQDVERSPGAVLSVAQGSDDFFLTDVSIGYRLPKRLGIASLSVTNLFDKDFKYQDDSYREFQDQPSIGPYFPKRLIFGRITLNW